MYDEPGSVSPTVINGVTVAPGATGSSIAACDVLNPAWCGFPLPLWAAAGIAIVAIATATTAIDATTPVLRPRLRAPLELFKSLPFPLVSTAEQRFPPGDFRKP
jgi:hypothetical protein